MAISFQCGQCGRAYKMPDPWAGKTVKCKDCGNSVTIPTAADASLASPGLDVYGLNDADSGGPRPGVGSPQAAASAQSARKPASAAASRQSQSAKSSSESSGGKTASRGTIGALIFLAVIGFRFYTRTQRNQARQANRLVTAPMNGPQGLMPTAALRPSANQRPAVWTMPSFSEAGPGSEIEPGIRFHEIKIGPSAGVPSRIPGHRGKLWLYLPAGNQPPKSLPCVLIAPAGSNLVTGMDLGDGDRPEHLPYVRAGFAVIAYELDGALPTRGQPNERQLMAGVVAFTNAQAGLVNAQVALEFATTRVPAIDPKRIFVAGHSSAATLALVLAENEPRAAGCVAFAPAVDLTIQYPPEIQQQITRPFAAATQLFGTLNPRSGEAKIQIPVFLFYADDDARFASQVRDLAERLSAAGKKVTVEHAPRGGHYESMIREGIPRAIKWLTALSTNSPRGGGS